jgi:hypothetical protein
MAVRVFLSIFMLAGVAAIGCGLWLLVHGLQSTHWPVTDGAILTAQMSYHSGDHGGTYSADISYNYQVAGTNYVSTHLAFGSMSSSSSYAQGILNRYPVGKKVQVHYAPDDPKTAVLETGIHGGTWICLGVGTAFILFAIMFMQLVNKAAAPNSGIPAIAPNTIGLQKPPILMAVIFIFAGSAVCFIEPGSGTPRWIVYAAGGLFVLGGLLILSYRFENKIFRKILVALFLLVFLAIFHWVSFGSGARNGTMTTPLSTTHGVSVRLPFAIFTVLMDAIIVGTLIYRLAKRRKD